MKFLCGNCKAKYQIADEKASGRTLRMKCRRCGHDILIDGHAMPATASQPPSGGAAASSRRTAGSTVSVMPGPARGGSGVAPLPVRPQPPPQAVRPPAARSKPPASLSQDFRRHIAAPPEVPQRTAPYDLWHVAIQDVPVGPMTRDELGRKIDAGAVSADSLCWREGMDDWRPLGELPELAALLRRPRGGQASQRPPRPPRTPPVVPAPPRASMFPPGEFEEIDEEQSEPTRIADITSGQPALAAAAAMPQAAANSSIPRTAAVSSHSVPSAVATPASIPGEGSVAVPLPRRERMSGSTGIALGLVAGILIVGGPALYRTFWETAPPAPAPQAAVVPTAPVEKPKSTEVIPTQDIEAPVPEEPVAKPRGNGTRPPKSSEPAKPPKDNLTDEQRKLLARMGGGEDREISSSKLDRDTGGGGGGGPTLTAQQLTGVVQNNKVQLQRCYESALRAAGGRQDGAIKITVKVVVGESGLVKSVSTQGTGLGNMTDCMKSSVKRWRFPASGGESEFEFPLVFQPGA